MTAISALLLFVSALCLSLADQVTLHRFRRGTRRYREVCTDTLSTSVYARGATWLRWRGLQAEFCRCTSRGREQCHRVPVTTCYIPYCYNGGTCKEAVYTSDFLCVCQAGFTGLQCEINTAEKCIVGRGESYRGTWSVTQSGLSCLNWNSTALQGKKFNALKPRAGTQGLGNHNYCRNPDDDSTPWCYVYKGIQIEWEYCSLPSCPTDPDLECLKDTGKTYRGTAAQTKTGQRCLPWDFPVLRSKVYNAWRSDAVDLGLASHSYCRNPDGDLAPWCHVYKGLKLTWEFCDIRLCEKPPLAPSISGIHAPTAMNRGTCGLREQRALQFRIRGGQKSDITLQPWQAAIRVYLPRPKIYSFFCGGVLIDSCWVLSAAHCFSEGYKAENLQVTLGRTFRLQNSSSDQIFGVEDYWVHDQYDEATEDNDIMLLKLKSDNGICAVYTPEVRPVCLPEPDLVLPEWTECEISGYGKDKEFDAEYSNQVKRGHVRLWPDSQCLPEKLSNRPVTQNMICAGDTRGLDDACKGDSGGPLVCPKDGRLTLLGIVSWGDGCGKKDVPGVYTRVTRYVSWITNKMQANSN
ncbi:tissue-type plasminogen activator [Paramormyrops kingsleyae]|uniref:tissue-type plasminogen activator n=1 Tax=Paramormyrops kingsleyae TaxID=1676925 RepID=UPI003B96AB4A